MRGQGSGHPSTDDGSPLLPEEEQLYHEFELYLRAVSDEAARAMIQQIDQFAKRLREDLIPLEKLPQETQSKLDSALRNLAELSHNSALQIQQKMDSSSQRLEGIGANIEERIQGSFNRLDTLAERAEARVAQNVVLLRNLLFCVVALTVLNLLLVTALLFKTWR